MTEHDRGAYTPQPDAPLQFDARGPRVRRPMPMTLIGSGAVLVVLLGALALHYRADNKPEKPAAPVAEKVDEVKPPPAMTAAAPAKPAALAAAATSGAPVDVFGGAAHDPGKAPTLAAPPEAPKPRQQLTVQATETPVVRPVPTTVTTPALPAAKPTTMTVARSSNYKAPAAATLTPPPAKPKADATQIVNSLATQAPTRVAPPIKAAAPTVSPAKPATLASAAPTKSPASTSAKVAAAAPASASGAVVQIGAFSSAALSDKGWSDVSSAMAGSMSGKTKRVEVVEKDGKTFYRTSVVGFPSRAAADSFCKALSARGKACFAKGA